MTSPPRRRRNFRTGHGYEADRPKTIGRLLSTTTSPSMVYVVDDDPETLQTLIDILALSGITARGFGSGGPALAAAHGANRPTVAILEHRLPDTTGIDLATSLKSEDADLSVVLLTGDATVAAVGPVDAYLAKPVQADELLRSVRAGLERTQLRRSDRDLVTRNQEMKAFLATISHGLRTP